MSLIKVNILAVDSTGAAMKSAKKKTQELERAYQKAANQMKLIGVAAVFGLTKAVQAFSDFDKGIREIGTLLDGVTEDSIQMMGEEIKGMAVEYGQALDVMTKARYDVVSAGFTDAADAANLLGEAAKLATAGVSTVARTADVMTSVLNAYGKAANESAKISDILFTTVRLGKTTIDQLAAGLGRAAAVAPTVGVSIEELSAAVATLTAQGLNTDEAMTAMQATMTQLISPSQELQKTIEQVGFSSGAAAVRALGFQGALELLTEGATETDLAARFPNVRAMRAVFPLVGDAAGKFATNLEEINDSAGATDKAFEKMTQGIAFRLAQLGTRWQEVMIEIGEAMLPIVNALIDFTKSFLDLNKGSRLAVLGVTALGIAFAVMVPTLNAMIVSTRVAGVSTSLLGFTMVGATGATRAFSFSVRGLGVAIKTALGPAGLFLIAIGAIIPLIFTLDSAFDDAVVSVDAFTESVKKMDFGEKISQLQDLGDELDRALLDKAVLLRDLASGLQLTGSVNITGQKMLEDLTNKIVELQRKTGILTEDLGTTTIPPINLEVTGIDSVITQIRLAKVQALQMADAVTLVQDAIDKSKVDGRQMFVIKGAVERLKKVSDEAEIASKKLQNIRDIASQMDLSKLSDEKIKLLAFSIGVTVEELKTMRTEVEATATNLQRMADIKTVGKLDIETAEFKEKLADALDTLKEREKELQIEAKITLATEGGTVSEKAKTELEGVRKAVIGVTKLMSQQFGEIVTVEALRRIETEKQVNDAILAARGAFFESLAQKEISANEASIQKRLDDAKNNRGKLQVIRDEANLTTLEQDIQAYATRLEAAGVQFWDPMTEGYKLFYTKVGELTDEHNESELDKFKRLQLEKQEAFDRSVNRLTGAFNNLANMEIASVQRKESFKLKIENRAFESRKAQLIKQHTVNGAITQRGLAAIEELEQNHANATFAITDKAQRDEEAIKRRLKPIKIAQAISNVALAVTKAMPNPFLVAATIALGATQIATIASQPYSQGGIIGEDRPLSKGDKIIKFDPVGTDTIPAMLTPGEAVIPKSMVDQNRGVIESLINGTFTRPSNFAEGAIVGDGISSNAGDTFNETNVDESRVINNNVTLNFEVNSESIDPSAAAEAVDELVHSQSFQDAFKEAVNDGEIKILSAPAGGLTEVR